MAKKGDVDLIIRAKNDASKSLDAITRSLKELKDQQAIVGNSAGTTNGQLSALSLELQRLRANAQNMQQLSNIANVLNSATSALTRQRDAVADAGKEIQKLGQQETDLKNKQSALAASLRSATSDLDQQRTSSQAAKDALATLNKEATGLATTQRNTQRSLDAVTRLIQTQEKALAEAAAKHGALAKAVADTDKPTKRLTASLEAAERALTKRQAALDASRAKEKGFQDTLRQTAAAQAANASSAQLASLSLSNEAKALEAAKAKVSALNTEVKSLGQTQRTLDGETSRSAANLASLKAALDAAENEYKQLQNAANQAKAAVGGAAATTTNAGAAAAAAAVQLATFAARARVLQAGSGSTTAGLNINVADVNAATGALRNAQAVVQATQRSYSAAAVSAQDLRNALTAMGSAVSSLTPLSKAVTDQRAAVDGAYQSWKTAEAEVKRLALAIKAAGAPSEALAAAFGTAQGQARLAKTEFQNQSNTAKQLAQSLQQAGVGAGTLASAEASLQGTLRATTSTIAQGTDALNRMSQAEDTAAQGGNRLLNFLRTLMSSGGSVASALGQAAGSIVRLRDGAVSAAGPVGSLSGELKGLAAQVVGLYALKQGIEGVLNVSTGFDAMGAKLRVAFGGDMAKANEAMEYSLTVAKNLKLPLLETTKGYADMAVAARGTALEGKGVNDIFTAFAQAARVTRTSSADLNGIFRALTQSISKGKVQAEELRGQLGDRLPGAIQIMATALGVSTKELDKMMVNGELTIDTLHRMAGEVSKRVAPELESALDSPAAKIQEFKNKWTELQLTLAKSGFLDAIANAAVALGDALSRPEVVEGVTNLGKSLADMVNWLVTMQDPLETIKTGFEVLIGVAVGTWAIGVVSGITSIIGGLYGLATAAAAADIALAPIVLTIGLLAAAVALPFLATWAYDNFPVFAKLCLSIKGVALEVWSGIVEGWNVSGALLKNSFSQVINEITAMWKSMMSWIATTSASILDKVGLGGLVDDWQKEAADAAAKAKQDAIDSQKKHEAEINGIHEAAAKERADIEADIQRQIQDKLTEIARKGESERAKTAVVPAVTATGTGVGTGQVTPPAGQFKPDSTKADEAAAKKRVALEQRVADQISSIQSRLDTNKANSLDQQIAGVEEKYRGLYDDLRKLGLSENSEQWKTVDALKAQEIQLVKNRAAKAASVAQAKQEKDAQQNINDMLALRKDYIDQIKYAESKGDYTTADTLKQKYNELNDQTRQAIDSQIAYWQAAGGPGADLAIAKLQAQKDSLNNVKETSILTAQTIGTQFGQSLSSFGDNFLTLLSQTGDVFGSLKDSFREFAASFLLEMAKMILKQQIFNALQAASKSGGIFGTFFGAAAASVGSAHTGGLAGSPGLNQRSVNPAVFAGAMKYHTGGVVGLQPWEVPIIAKKNEEVLTEDDPRHISNLGAGGDSTNGGNGNSSMPNFQIINAIDADEVVQRGLSSPAGTKVVMNLIQANRSKIKGLIGG